MSSVINPVIHQRSRVNSFSYGAFRCTIRKISGTCGDVRKKSGISASSSIEHLNTRVDNVNICQTCICFCSRSRRRDDRRPRERLAGRHRERAWHHREPTIVRAATTRTGTACGGSAGHAARAHRHGHPLARRTSSEDPGNPSPVDQTFSSASCRKLCHRSFGQQPTAIQISCVMTNEISTNVTPSVKP